MDITNSLALPFHPGRLVFCVFPLICSTRGTFNMWVITEQDGGRRIWPSFEDDTQPNVYMCVCACVCPLSIPLNTHTQSGHGKPIRNRTGLSQIPNRPTSVGKPDFSLIRFGMLLILPAPLGLEKIKKTHRHTQEVISTAPKTVSIFPNLHREKRAKILLVPENSITFAHSRAPWSFMFRFSTTSKPFHPIPCSLLSPSHSYPHRQPYSGSCAILYPFCLSFTCPSIPHLSHFRVHSCWVLFEKRLYFSVFICCLFFRFFCCSLLFLFSLFFFCVLAMLLFPLTSACKVSETERGLTSRPVSLIFARARKMYTYLTRIWLPQVYRCREPAMNRQYAEG